MMSTGNVNPSESPFLAKDVLIPGVRGEASVVACSRCSATAVAGGAGGGNGVDQCLEPPGVVPVGGFAPGHQRQTPGIGHEGDRHPWFGAIGRVGAEARAPLPSPWEV